ncbi:MAG: beta-hydroxyacyl-ACP dehydratase [Phycisphaerae bacterium]|nr:beta-hydroxyacyl-ACP dehydratase [Phycisphaerae bacterium]
MKFYLVDKIESISPGKRIVTYKALSLAEEYLADHFPAFPVLPGVLMLEALAQSAAWLLRVQQDFTKSIIVLAAARNVRYANFVQPGNILRCEVTATETGEETSKFKGQGFVDDGTAVSAQLELRSFNLTDRSARLAEADRSITAQLKEQFELIGGPAALKAAEA